MSQVPSDYLSTASPYNYEQPLPSVARMSAVMQVPPAKRTTFYKSGDPQFGGVKMAINQRSFKSFNALMDDLSNRVPLPFGVRTITTPRGVHCINTLDQLEDGGCYLCSDKKYITPISIGPAWWRAGSQKTDPPASDLRRVAQDVKHEGYSTAFTQQSPRIPKKVTLVKNRDVTTRWPVILNHRNAQSFKTLLDEISEIMQFTVKKVYTVDGKRIDSMQGLLNCPNVLICVGREPFKPIMMENARKCSLEKLPGLASQSNSNNIGENHEMNFGLKAKKSVIHPRSALSNRSMRFSLSSEKPYPNGLTASPENAAPSLNHCPCAKAGDLVHSLAKDNIEKRVHVNKDGSLSVEMKVHFRLLNDETLQWSTQVKKSSLMDRMPYEELGADNGVDPIDKGNTEASSKVDDSLYPSDADSYISNVDEPENDEACCQSCGKPCKGYDIWMNPMHVSPKEEPGVRNSWRMQSSCSSTSSHRRVVRERMASVESIHTSFSGEEYSKHFGRESGCYSETLENRVESKSTVKKCHRRQCDRIQTNTSERGSPEEMDTGACLGNSQNEDNAMVSGEGDNNSRAGSSKSKSSRCSAESQIRAHEKSGSVTRTTSSCRVKEREDAEDGLGCPSPPNSTCRKPPKCIAPGPKDNRDEACPKKEAVEEDVEEEGEEINEIHSISENMASNQAVKDEVCKCGRCSTERSLHSKACDGNSQRSDGEEIQVCSAAASSSSRRSKHSQKHQEAGSKLSRGSTVKKKTKSSLHAEGARVNSSTSYYSRSSHEVERRAGEGHALHDSSSPHSHASSLSEAAEHPVNNNVESDSSSPRFYSTSSKGSQRGSWPDDSSKGSSPSPSFSVSNGENGTAKVTSQEHSSRPGSVPESTCSKCGHVAAARNDDLGSVHPRVSSHSESECAETEIWEGSDRASSQLSMVQFSKLRQKQSSLRANVECCSYASASEPASMYSLRCPAPPKGRPSGRKSGTLLLKKKTKSGSTCAESEPAADKKPDETATSQTPEMDIVNGPRDRSDPLNGGEGSCQGKGQGEAEVEGDDDVAPSSLPNASPEEVVHEWLRKIPSETLLMKCEVQDDGEGTELGAERPRGSNNQELLAKESVEKREDEEGPEAADEGAEQGAVEEEANESPSDEEASKGMSEEAKVVQVKCSHPVISRQNNRKKDLPGAIQTSVQIMKALLAAKQEAKLDRSHSLPEVSPTMGRKLSNSANILITCLASLQLLDEELDPPNESSKCLNRPIYMELLNIFQALWFGCASEKGPMRSGLHRQDQAKAPSAFKGHNSKDGDFTPMSSSGVDVSSGDGGSGEGSMAGARDCAWLPEKTNEAKLTEREAKAEEGDGGEEEEEEHSRPPMPCSKSEGGEKAKSTGGEKVTEANENPGSDCEIGGEEEEEIGEEDGMEENDKQEDDEMECVEANAGVDPPHEEAQEDPVAEEAQKSRSQENADEAPEEPSINAENADEAAKEPSINAENADEAAEEPSINAENADEEAEEPSINAENVGEAAEEPSINAENAGEAAEEPSINAENAGEAAEEPSNSQAEPEPNEGSDESEPKATAEKSQVDESETDTGSSNTVPCQATAEASLITQQNSIHPDPFWVLKLLKTIEKEFMTHYVSAMNDFKVKWNLPNSEELDLMIAELNQEVSRRIHKSIEKELGKISSRAGKRVPRPPDNLQLRRESPLQVESRRRHLQSIHKMSLYNDRSQQPETRDESCDIDQDFLFNATIRDDFSKQPSEEEYCPCDACVREKMAAQATRSTTEVMTNAPVVKAFDLQQILRMKKVDVAERQAEDHITEEGQGEEGGEGKADGPEAKQETRPHEE
ncbi:retinitis pigmentosa 1-like 1 protein [Rhineura floridana]|uniref:retinitis pigmentosa 1-like 1 protein n=1 Tax=Rhineura floridana TaxID=261503 RepID=UPI002AC8557A|nr:retinitis pigmentosa 1-like 1 protein [Rhineura floridana]